MGRRCLTTSTLFCGLTTGLGLNLCLARTTGLLPPTGSSVRPSGLGSSSASCCGCCWASTAPQTMADTARTVTSLAIVPTWVVRWDIAATFFGRKNSAHPAHVS